MAHHDFHFQVSYKHRLYFLQNAFSAENRTWLDALDLSPSRKLLCFVEQAVIDARPELAEEIATMIATTPLTFSGTHVLLGGEISKASAAVAEQALMVIDRAGIDRHSYVLVIGGGAFLDVIGYAAALAHRGLRLLRMPTTTLAQADSGVGVKCAINHFGKKNWLGVFSVPHAVIIDSAFLKTLSPEVRREGLIEALKVALVKDCAFYESIASSKNAWLNPSNELLESCIERSALLHAGHICEGGDPFESGSSRPLDFGHWSAHKLEALTDYTISHAAAVAVGIALDLLISARLGHLDPAMADEIFELIECMGFATYHPALDLRDASGKRAIHCALEEFREHLGGELALLMLRKPGAAIEINHIDHAIIDACIDQLGLRHDAVRAKFSP